MNAARSARALALALLTAASACGGARAAQPGRRPIAKASPPPRTRAGGLDEGPLGPMLAVTHSTEHDRLVARGIVPEQLRSADERTRQAVMESFCVSLGVQCSFCHARGDYEQVTPRVFVAAAMWLKFTRAFVRRDGGPLYCDSCHHGAATFLARGADDGDALARFMHGYIEQIRPRGGGPMRCESCHGRPFTARFLPRMPLSPPPAPARS